MTVVCQNILSTIMLRNVKFSHFQFVLTLILRFLEDFHERLQTLCNCSIELSLPITTVSNFFYLKILTCFCFDIFICCSSNSSVGRFTKIYILMSEAIFNRCGQSSCWCWCVTTTLTWFGLAGCI